MYKITHDSMDDWEWAEGEEELFQALSYIKYLFKNYKKTTVEDYYWGKIIQIDWTKIPEYEF